MDINKKNRSDLKSYFVKNSIPTESNFSELIDGMLNQKDDGIVKSPGDPLSIEAAGDINGLQKVINFYAKFQDPSPSWSLQLNPHTDRNRPETAKAGFCVADGQNTPRLFIDKSNGNIGIGTTTPTAKLHIMGSLSVNENISNSGTLNVTGATTLSSTLAVTGPTTFSGNVGIGLVDPKVRLDVKGVFIRKIQMITGNGPEDDTDEGRINSRTLNFTKYQDATAIRIFYCDNIRVSPPRGTDENEERSAARWEIRIDGKTAPNGAIYMDKYSSRGGHHNQATLLGYAKGLAAGMHTIEIWVGLTPDFPRPLNDAFTGWHNSSWTLEAQEVWL
ncbi:MAG: hypothetical protein ACU83U_10450 [Gammaproteobacteria bacterium]